MGFSSDPSNEESLAQDQARIFQRKLYRPGQTEPAAAPAAAPRPQTGVKTSLPAAKSPLPAVKKPTASAQKASKPWSPRWKKAGQIAAVLLAMFALGTASYLFADPDDADLRAAKRARDSAFDRNLSPEERGEKFREMREAERYLSPRQKSDMNRDFLRKRREKTDQFIHLSDEEQEAQLRERILRMEEFRKKMQAKWAGKNRNGGKGKGGGGGPPGGGRGGNNNNNNAAARAARQEQAELRRMDGQTPEDRAGGEYMRDKTQQVRQKMGLGNGGGRGGWGGGWGGGGGPKGGGR